MAKATKQENPEQDKYAETIKKLEARYGIGTIIHGKDVKEDLEVVTTGSISLDIATGLGGNPVGKLIEIFGPESSGKSTLCLHMTSGFQKLDGECLLVDYEHSYDKTYATALGVDVDRLTIIQPDCMEDGYNIIETLIRTGKVRFVIIDSHTAGLPKVVIAGEVGDATVAAQARINSVALGKIKPLLKPNRCTMVGVSQLRSAIGSQHGGDKPSGGNAWKFYSDIRYKVWKSNDIEKEMNKTTVDVIKNKCSCPFGKAEFNINWGTGVDRQKELIDFACEFDLIKVGGSWFTVGETKFQGMDKVKQFLTDNPDYATDLETQVMEKIKGGK